MRSPASCVSGFRRSRRGGIYVAVMGAAVLTSLIGVSGIIAARVQAKASVTTGDVDEARSYARAAIEIGRVMISGNSSWRTAYSAGSWFSGKSIGGGTCSLSVIDPSDPNLNHNANDSVILTGTGTKGRATQQMQVTLVAQASALTCLTAPLTCVGAMTLSSVTLTSDTPIMGNAGISAVFATINADVQSASTVTGSTYKKTTTNLVTALTVPAASVIDTYKAMAANIPYASLPLVSSVGQLSGQLLSPTNNPYGTTNANGIYVIDCGNHPINIANCRILGTLVLVNCPATSTVQGSVLFQPYVINYPSLLVKGAIAFKQSNASLSEATVGANFNPSGVAYNGVTNATNTDTYPSVIQGLVYVSGNVTISNHPVFNGCVIVGGTLSAGGAVDFTYDKSFNSSPPTGFTAGTVTMKLSEGTWKQVVN